MAPHTCSQGDRILILEQTEKQMAKDISLILTKLEAMDKKMDDRAYAMNDFILTAPQKFADKQKFLDFQTGINTKIAIMTGIWTAVMGVIGILVFLISNFYHK